jgi:serine phosphatase RsbU (regulator of sigma subunit)
LALVKNLLILYAGLVLINTALSAALWYKSRDLLYRSLVLVWGSTLLSYLAQGVLAQSPAIITYSFATVFLVNLALASLVSQSVEMPFRWQPFATGLILALALTAIFAAENTSFLLMALPVTVAVSLPSLVVATRVARHWRLLSVVTRGLVVSSVLFSLHNIDFAFLRDRPALAPLGFTVATLIIFALSITAPAVVLERVAERHARMDVEVETARRIQTKLLPGDVRLPGIEFVSYMHPAESVGGDYLDIHTTPNGSWLFLGDVTGHGLGAGLVTLMAQSTVSSILEARPDIRPAELNFLANRILAANLARMGEQRHLTFVALRSVGQNAFLVSGSHDTAFIYRATTQQVEPFQLTHFPIGIGFIGNLGKDDFLEQTILLNPGDALFVGSDGITEAAWGGDVTKGQFGEDALIEILRNKGTLPLPELKSALLDRLDAHTGGVYHDDVSFVIVRTATEPMVAPVSKGEAVPSRDATGGIA